MTTEATGKVRYHENMAPCPFCRHKGANVLKHRVISCGNEECDESFFGGIHTSIWKKRPIEDDLREQVRAMWHLLVSALGHLQQDVPMSFNARQAWIESAREVLEKYKEQG